MKDEKISVLLSPENYAYIESSLLLFYIYYFLSKSFYLSFHFHTFTSLSQFCLLSLTVFWMLSLYCFHFALHFDDNLIFSYTLLMISHLIFLFHRDERFIIFSLMVMFGPGLQLLFSDKHFLAIIYFSHFFLLFFSGNIFV